MRPFSGSSPWLLALPMKGEIPSGGFLAVNSDSLLPFFPFPLNKVPLTKKLQVVVPIYRMMTNEKKILYTSCMSVAERNGISRDEVEGKIRGETKLFHEETDIKCFVILYSDE
jgi:hypothetical protein